MIILAPASVALGITYTQQNFGHLVEVYEVEVYCVSTQTADSAKVQFSHLCKKAVEMTTKLIRYFGFSVFNCLEITVLGVWKTWGISFCQICKHPVV